MERRIFQIFRIKTYVKYEVTTKLFIKLKQTNNNLVNLIYQVLVFSTFNHQQSKPMIT